VEVLRDSRLLIIKVLSVHLLRPNQAARVGTGTRQALLSEQRAAGAH
jgi:hypothetical protein